MPIQDLGPSEMGRRGLERAQDAIELSRSAREKSAKSAGDAASTELHRTAATERVAPGASHAHPATESAAGDRVELSLAAQALSAGEDPTVAARRGEHVAKMQSAIEAGTLATAERLERAAERLLGG